MKTITDPLCWAFVWQKTRLGWKKGLEKAWKSLGALLAGPSSPRVWSLSSGHPSGAILASGFLGKAFSLGWGLVGQRLQRHLGQPASRAAPFLALSRGGGLRKGRHPGHLAYFLGFQKEAPDCCHFPWHCFSFRSSSATHSSQRSAGDIQQQSLYPIPISCFWLSRQFCPCTSRGPEHPWPMAPSLPACQRSCCILGQ